MVSGSGSVLIASKYVATGGPYILGAEPDKDFIAALDPQTVQAMVAVIEACNGLIGLVQLVAKRGDLPAGLDDLMLLSHRMTEARAALARLEELP